MKGSHAEEHCRTTDRRSVLRVSAPATNGSARMTSDPPRGTPLCERKGEHQPTRHRQPDVLPHMELHCRQCADC